MDRDFVVGDVVRITDPTHQKYPYRGTITMLGFRLVQIDKRIAIPKTDVAFDVPLISEEPESVDVLHG